MRHSSLVGLEQPTQWVGFSCLLKLQQKPEEQLRNHCFPKTTVVFPGQQGSLLIGVMQRQILQTWRAGSVVSVARETALWNEHMEVCFVLPGMYLKQI